MTYRRIREALSSILSIEEDGIRPDMPLWGAVDAVSVAKLVIFCENQFRIKIRDERVCTFLRLIDLVRHVEALMGDGPEGYRQPTDDGRTAWYYE